MRIPRSLAEIKGDDGFDVLEGKKQVIGNNVTETF